jgi:hypothetical protein
VRSRTRVRVRDAAYDIPDETIQLCYVVLRCVVLFTVELFCILLCFALLHIFIFS